MNSIALIVVSMIGQVLVDGQTCPTCPGGVCLPQTKAVAQQTPLANKDNPCPTYQWVKWMDGRLLLKRDGVIIGQYYVADQLYYPWDGVKNLPATKPPTNPMEETAVADWQVNGVGVHNISGGEVLTYGGRVIAKKQMAAAFEGKLTDDSDKGYMIILAKDEAKRGNVLADYQKLPEEFRNRYHLWMADPSHFTMQDRYNGKPRFFTEGDPSVILENSKGEVLFRRPQAGQVYRQGDMQDLMKSDPNYNPALDPGAPVKSLTDYLPKLSAQTWGYLGFGALVGFAALKRRKDDGPQSASVSD